MIPSMLMYRIRGLSVFIGKNSKALKRRKYKGFCVFWLYRMLATLLKYEENKVNIYSWSVTKNHLLTHIIL